MNAQEILSKCDHTLLAQTASLDDIKKLCDDAVKYKVASVCIPPCYVADACSYLYDKDDDNEVRICTVIGFPNGNSSTLTKMYEANEAIANGADEIDMVINIGMLKDRRYDYVQKEITAVKGICGYHTLKVIVETCLLTQEEKEMAFDCVVKGQADYIKTSTGFSKGGATVEDIKLFSDLREQYVKAGFEPIKIKASGGIGDLESAKAMIEAGADRIGESRLINDVRKRANTNIEI